MTTTDPDFDAEEAELQAKADRFLTIAAQRDELPDGLCVLSVEFEQTPAEYNEYRARSGNVTNGDMEDVFDHVGITRIRRQKGTCFGPADAKYIRFRVDFIGKSDLLEKIPISGLGVKRAHSQRFGNVRHLFKECGEAYEFGFKGWYPENFANFDEWARAAQVTADEINKLVDLYEVTGGRLASMAAAIRRTRAEAPKNTFLVPGLIPDGAPTLLLGNRKAGKSTALLELAVAVARREPEWMGFPLNHERRGLAIYLSGEDSEAEVIERVRRMTGGETPYGLHVIPARGGDLDEIVENMQKENPRLFIVDPARKYFKGDEDGSDAASDLFNRIEPLVQSKNCAAIVSHHLKRGANPRTVAEVAEYVRGSGVWLDRPRVTLGMLRSGDETLFGISGPAEAPLHNFRRDTMFAGARRLRRDDPTSRHIPIDRPHTATKSAPATDELTSVMAAAKGLLDRGERITRTGPKELFKHRAPEIAGWSRAKVRAAVEELTRTAQLVLSADGSLSIASQPEPAFVE
jgi:hypothetical protein